MKVKIKTSLFKNSTCFRKLDTLIGLFDEGRHHWVIPVLDVDSIQESNWKNAARPEMQITVGKYIEEIASSEFYEEEDRPSIVVVENVTDEDNELELSIALEYLQETVLVIVENEIYEAYFLDSLFQHFNGSDILNAKNKRWLRYDSIGGKGQLPTRIERDVFQRPFPPRIMVLVDSDKLYPDMPLPNGQTKIKDTCEKHNILYHVLYKREMENYLPDEAFLGLPNYMKVKHVHLAYRHLFDINIMMKLSCSCSYTVEDRISS